MKSSFTASKWAALGQLYSTFDLLRSQAAAASGMAGRLMEQRDCDDLEDISTIANKLIGRAMKIWDCEVQNES